jgi:hypothetical protein
MARPTYRGHPPMARKECELALHKRKVSAVLAGLLLVLSAAPVLAGSITVTKFTAHVQPAPGMTADCAGLHTVTTKHVTDNEICFVTDTTHTLVAGTFKTFSADAYAGSWPAFDNPICGCTFWGSDFDGALASNWKVVVIGLGHGRFLWIIAASYPLP